MKKLPILFYFIATTAHAQDTVEVDHIFYTSYFAISAHIPVLVTYTLHKKQISCENHIVRTNNFREDPICGGTDLKNDYAHSGYDKGHNMSAENNACNAIGMSECFYYDNMYPQTPNLNRGIWKKLEVHERKEAIDNDSIMVFIGSYGRLGAIGNNNVLVPAMCWKVIYVFATRQWEIHIFNNDDNAKEVELTAPQRAWVYHIINHFTGYKPKKINHKIKEQCH